MKKHLLFLLLLFSISVQAQVTPAPIFRTPDAETVFGQSVMSGSILCDIGTGKTYRMLRSVLGSNSLSALTINTDYVELTPQEILSNSLYTYLVYGTVTWYGTGMVYDVSPCRYYILGELYNSAAGQVTLDDGEEVLNRIDVIWANYLGEIGVTTGEPAVNPFEPLIDDETQIRLTSVLVPAGATEPPAADDLSIIYRENVEWTTAVVNESAGTTITFDNTVTPFSGTKCVNVVSTGNLNSSKFSFTGTPRTFLSNEVFVFYVKTSATWPTRSVVTFRWFNSSNLVSQSVQVTNGSYGFNATSTAWQKIAIPVSVFHFSSPADVLLISFIGTWTPKTIKFDNFEIQSNADISENLDGTGTKFYLPVWVNSQTLGSSVVSEKAGKIGINVLDAEQPLDVNGTAQIRGNLMVKTIAENNNAGDKNYLVMDGDVVKYITRPDSDVTSYMLLANTGTGGAWIQILGSNGSKDSLFLAAGTNMTSIVQTDDHTITFNAEEGGTGATYTVSAETVSENTVIQLLGSDESTDNIILAPGTNMTSIVRTDENTFTFNAANQGAGGLVDDINFEFADIVYGTAQTYTLDIKASYGYTINSASLETDTGTLTGIAVKIGSTDVTSLSSVTADATVDETAATGANTVVAGNRVYIVTSTGYTGVPTVLRGKLKITRT